jgi:hypothetical protein
MGLQEGREELASEQQKWYSLILSGAKNGWGLA